MSDTYDSIKLKIKELYADSSLRFGNSSRGVGWKDETSHELRLRMISEVGISDGCSVLDVGCGYGALWEHLVRRGVKGIKYTGIDIVENLTEMARKRFRDSAKFEVADIMELDQEFDYVLNLGIFNVKLDSRDVEFLEHFVKPILLKMWALAKVGVAASFMTDMVDYKNRNLYYASPSEIFNFLRERLSRHVSLRHDYGLYEFTAYVYKHAKS
ncbi:MAG TPA: class I SAM-dependent methyltransferase [Candidatus Bathyarchaeia archaeon]|nr:class I SAM-dependent methyltransferase [Candidatus Bathyarchaeia archaeon]